MSSSEALRGRRLGIDPGAARVGVAVCDPDGILATPLATIARDDKASADIAEIARLAREYDVVEVVVGQPTGLSGNKGRAAEVATAFAERLAEAIAPIPITRIDERFTTVTASGSLHEAGLNARQQRSVIDQAAATVILQNHLDRLRTARRVDGS